MRHNLAQRVWRWINRETLDRRPQYFIFIAAGMVTAASGGLRIVFDPDPARFIDVIFVLIGVAEIVIASVAIRRWSRKPSEPSA